MKDRIVLVTGAAQGIGAAIAARFSAMGCRIVLLDRDQDGSKAVEALGGADRARFVECDLQRPEQVTKAVAEGLEAFGGLDVLVNNAGITMPRSLEETELDDWNRVQDINLRAAYLTTRHARAALVASDAGAIVNIASYHAGSTIENFAAYASSKAGVVGLTKSSALEFAPHGIRVNAVCPGAVHTGMIDSWLETVSDPDAAMASMLEKQPLGRLGKGEDIAAAVAFLAGPEAGYITGTTLYVDGGVSARLWHA